MIRRITSILGLLFITTIGLSQTDTTTYKNTADSLRINGKFEEAVSHYDEMIVKDTNNEMHYRGRGHSYMFLSKWDKARADYLKAVELNSGCYNCFLNLSTIEGSIGSLEKAMEMINKAIAIDPSESRGYYIRGEIKMVKRDNIGVLIDYNKAIELAPNEPQYYVTRGHFNDVSGFPREATRDYSKAILLDSSYHLAWFRRSYSYAVDMDYKKAMQDIDKAITLANKNPEYLMTKGKLLMIEENHEQSIEFLLSSLEIDTAYVEALSVIAECYFSMEKMDEYCHYNQKLIDAYPEDTSDYAISNKKFQEQTCNEKYVAYHFHRAMASSNTDNPEKALLHLNNGLKLVDNDPILLNTRALVYAQLGKHDLALADFKKSDENLGMMETIIAEHYSNITEQIDEMRKGIDVQNYIGFAKSKMYEGKLNEALNYVNIAIEKVYTLKNYDIKANTYHLRGRVYMGLKQFDKAISDLNIAIYTLPDPLFYVNKALASLYKYEVSYQKTQQRNITMSLSGFGENRTASYTLPKLVAKQQNEFLVEDAMGLCNMALEKDPEFGYAYLIRANIKMMKEEPDVCMDATLAKKFGVTDAFEQLGISCD